MRDEDYSRLWVESQRLRLLGIMLVQYSHDCRFPSNIHEFISTDVKFLELDRHGIPFLDWILSPIRELLITDMVWMVPSELLFHGGH